jgi:hypothetical protein
LAEFLSVRENLGENTSCTHRHLWRARCELVCVYATGAVWDVACGLLLVQGMCDAACSLVPVNEVCRESTIKSSRQPVCRESCFDFRLRTSAPVCVAPEPRMDDGAATRESRGKMLTARACDGGRAGRRAGRGARRATEASTRRRLATTSPTVRLPPSGARRRSRTSLHVADRPL